MKGLSGRLKPRDAAKASPPLQESPAVSAADKPSRKRKFASIANSYDLHPGAVVIGRVDLAPKFRPPPGTMAVRVAPFVHGVVCATQVQPRANWVAQPFKPFKHDQFVRCKVLERLSPASSSSAIFLSLREELVSGEMTLAAEKSEAMVLPREGELVRGFVVSVSKAGCFVRVSRGVTAFVKLKNLADGFIEKPQEMFPVGKLVAGRVVAVNEKSRKLELSLKSTTVIDPKDAKWTWKSIKVGLSLPGSVRRCEKYGVFIALDNSANIVGLCHKSKLEDDTKVTDASTHYATGDRVKVKVLEVDRSKKRLALGLKPSYFANDPDSDDEEESESEDVEKEPENEVVEAVGSDSESEKGDQHSQEESAESESDGEAEKAASASVQNIGGVDDSSDSESEIHLERKEEVVSGKEDAPNETGAKRRKGMAGTSLQDLMKSASAKEEADAAESDSETSNDEEDDEGEPKERQVQQKKQGSSSRLRDRKRKREEAAIAQQEERLMENDGVLESVEDFERALVSSPNSSLLWIQYISFQLAQTEIEHAKTIAERALNTISFREEDEKRNVWRAYLKLEYKYGNEKTLQELFNRMLPQWNKKHAYYALAQVYRDDNKFDNADSALKKAVKASKGSSKGAWLQRIELLMDQGRPEEARKLLESAVRSLPKRKHIMTILRFVRMEFSKPSGNAERARTACEGLLDAHPKRTDIWHLYIDLEIKFGDKPKARRLFERVTTLKLSAKKMKTFFKKWLVFETEAGHLEEAENVKAKARAFVESLANA